MYFKESTTVAIFKHFFLDTETCTGVLKKKKSSKFCFIHHNIPGHISHRVKQILMIGAEKA